MKKMKFHHLKPSHGSKSKKVRVARGEGGRRGKTAGRGTKGTGARGTVPARFEGGQTPLYQRLPKLKGLKNNPKMSYLVVNLNDIADKNWSGEVNPDSLREQGLTKRKGLIKILGDGDIQTSIDVKINAISKNAKKKIEDAGGSVEIID
tara:strand:- start:1043 stop:1489 length:447 start_codon:yes stop_codon:yes gene_type:complete